MENRSRQKPSSLMNAGGFCEKVLNTSARYPVDTKRFSQTRDPLLCKRESVRLISQLWHRRRGPDSSSRCQSVACPFSHGRSGKKRPGGNRLRGQHPGASTQPPSPEPCLWAFTVYQALGDTRGRKPGILSSRNSQNEMRGPQTVKVLGRLPQRGDA